MPGFIKPTFIVLVLMLDFGGSLAIKCISVNNQPCMIRPMRINLNPDELRYCPFIVSMDRCDGICNIVEKAFGKASVPNETEDMNLEVFNMIKGISESKTLAKQISWECRCKFDGRKCNLRQMEQ